MKARGARLSTWQDHGIPRPWCEIHRRYLPLGSDTCVLCSAEIAERYAKVPKRIGKEKETSC